MISAKKDDRLQPQVILSELTCLPFSSVAHCQGVITSSLQINVTINFFLHNNNNHHQYLTCFFLYGLFQDFVTWNHYPQINYPGKQICT